MACWPCSRAFPDGPKVFDLEAATIALSIVRHSTTAVPGAKLLKVEPPDDLPNAPPARKGTAADTPE
jgi:hypothetical protein